MSNPNVVSQTGVGISPWQVINFQIDPVNISFACAVTGSVTYTLEYTYDDVLNVFGQNADPAVAPTVTAWPLSALTTQTTAKEGLINFPIFAWRLNVTVGTGTAKVSAIQAGINN